MCVCACVHICIYHYCVYLCKCICTLFARVCEREREICVCGYACLWVLFMYLGGAEGTNQFTVCFAAKALSRLRSSCFQSWCWTASPTASYEPSCGNSQSQCVGSLNSRDFDQAVSKEAQKYCQVHSLHPHRHAPEHCSGIRGRPRVLALSNFKAPKLGLNLDPCWIQVQ